MENADAKFSLSELINLYSSLIVGCESEKDRIRFGMWKMWKHDLRSCDVGVSILDDKQTVSTNSQQQRYILWFSL